MKQKIANIVAIVWAVFLAAALVMANFFGITIATHVWLAIPTYVIFYGGAGFFCWYLFSEMIKSRKTEG